MHQNEDCTRVGSVNVALLVAQSSPLYLKVKFLAGQVLCREKPDSGTSPFKGCCRCMLNHAAHEQRGLRCAMLWLQVVVITLEGEHKLKTYMSHLTTSNTIFSHAAKKIKRKRH